MSRVIECPRCGIRVRGKSDRAETDLGKANNYAHRLVYGGWRDSDE